MTRAREAVSGHVIVLLRSQRRTLLASSAGARARAAIQARERAPMIKEIRRSGGRVTHQYSTLNAFAATVSKAQAARLASNPAVARVVPDQIVQVPRDARLNAFSGASPPSAGSGPSTAPQTQTCPTDPSKPLLEPEALQSTNTAFTDTTRPQAQNIATGKGVKVAYFAEGIDINNPDFIRADGSHVFIDYRDFTAEGPNAPSPAAEAFGDASSIAAQGRQTYDLANFVNPAHPLPAGCNIQVRGMAPGASLIGMKVFGEGGAFSSVIIQAMDWAVNVDHADILSESFGGYPFPSTTNDLVKAFNDAAVAAGITVSQGTGDSGAQASPSSPADDPLVIDAAANTSFRLYAQTTSYGFQFSNGSYVSDNISSIGGGGFAQNGTSPDLVATGESGWALCTPDLTLYQECFDNAQRPASLLQFGGTSMATPLTAGAAALVIQAYRDTHAGATPSPALVKQILTSTANDLRLPSEEQGAGELDALKAVQAARSVNGGTPTGHSLLISPSTHLNVTGPAGSTPNDQNVTVTNVGADTQTVSANARAITSTISDEVQTVNLGASPTFVDQFGVSVPYVQTTFNVPAGADRLVAFDAWAGPNARVGLTLIDPNGTFMAYTRPQGNGNHGQVDVRDPVAGKWTALVFKRDGTFTGPVHLEFQAQRFGSVDSVSPDSLTLRPGQTGRFRVHLRLPNAPGDSGQDLVVKSSTGDSTAVPIVLRSLIRTNRHGGDFAGTIIGGNGRNGAEQPGQVDTFAFDVPRKSEALNASLTFPDDEGTEVQGYLTDPDGNMLGAATTTYQPLVRDVTQTTNGLRASIVDPKPGRWQFVVNIVNPVGGTVLTAPYRGHISFDAPRVRARGLPDGDKLKAGVPVTAHLTVRNDGPAIEDVFADPRLRGSTDDLPLLSLTPTAGLDMPGAFAAWKAPTQSTDIVGVASADKPIVLEMGFGSVGEGDPDLGGISSGNQAVSAYSTGQVAPGIWFLAPSLRGPFDAPTTGKVDTGMLVRTQSFDTNAEASTGDLERAFVDPNEGFAPLTLQPGQQGTIDVTFTPQGKKGDKVKGVIYIDDNSSSFLFFTNQQTAIPYRYRIG